MRILLILLLITTASAENVAHVRVLEDPGGDNLMAAGPLETPDPTDHANDLRFLDITEEVDGFWFTVGVESLERLGGDQGGSAIFWYVDFDHGTQRYQLTMIWGVDGGWRTDIYRFDASGSRSFVGSAAIERDFDAHTVRSYVERDLLRDQSGAPPQRGTAFTDVRVTTGGRTINPADGSSITENGDIMPDTGAGVYDVSWGAVSEGPIALSSPLPYRVSNGAATTYLFEIDVVNEDDEEHLYFFRPPTLPNGWSIRFPVDGVRLAPDEERRIPVLVTLPFAHSHGKIDRTTLELAAEGAPIVGRIEIGVLFLEVPQPSGHHPRLWLHTQEQVPVEDAAWHFVYTPGADVFMNGREDEPGDAGIPIRGFHYEEGYEWYAFLEPGLLTGLDFQVGRTGEVEVPLFLRVPMEGATFSGSLLLVGPETSNVYDDRPSSLTRPDEAFGGRELTQLGSLVPTAPASLSGEVELSSPLVLEEGVDLVEPRVGQTLLLRLRLEGTLPAGYAVEPELLGGVLELPLDEYADPIDTSFLNDLIGLELIGEAERFANPGDVLVFEAELSNPSSEDLEVGLELHGQGADWALLHGDARRSLPAGASQRVQVVLTVPNDAQDADRADLVLEAFDADDPTRRSLVRFVAHVDTDAAWGDDSHVVLEENIRQDASAPIGAALLALVVLMRRR